MEEKASKDKNTTIWLDNEFGCSEWNWMVLSKSWRSNGLHAHVTLRGGKPTIVSSKGGEQLDNSRNVVTMYDSAVKYTTWGGTTPHLTDAKLTRTNLYSLEFYAC